MSSCNIIKVIIMKKGKMCYMKYLATMYDNLIKKEYKLYLVNAKYVHDRLNKNYNLTKIQLQMFNLETKLAEYTKKMNDERHISEYTTEMYNKVVNNIENNNHIGVMTQIGVHMGYELMPIVLCAKGDFEKDETEIELIDGFRRMFCTKEVPNIDILVKVYDKLDDREWINSMIIYNSWKFKNGAGAKTYMDRGFQLGIYHRYSMNFAQMELLYRYYDMFKMVDIYTQCDDLNSYSMVNGHSRLTYETLWDNNLLKEDLIAIYKIFTYTPTFRIEKKNKAQEYDVSTERDKVRTGICRLYEVFVSVLGEIRKYEFNKGIKDRRTFDINIFYDYLGNKNMQKHFIKLTTMEVDGFIINYIIKNLRNGIKEIMYKGMGYDYLYPEKKIDGTPIKVLDETMF